MTGPYGLTGDADKRNVDFSSYLSKEPFGRCAVYER